METVFNLSYGVLKSQFKHMSEFIYTLWQWHQQTKILLFISILGHLSLIFWKDGHLQIVSQVTATSDENLTLFHRSNAVWSFQW